MIIFPSSVKYYTFRNLIMEGYISIRLKIAEDNTHQMLVDVSRVPGFRPTAEDVQDLAKDRAFLDQYAERDDRGDGGEMTILS
jgi:hypothetical protein